jgi:anti-anti-sigma factor
MPTPPPSPGSTVVLEIGSSSGQSDSDAARLHQKLRGLLSQGYECILVNVADLTYVDSVMLGAIMQAYASAIRVGTTVKLLHASRRVKELLAVTKLDRVLETVDSDQ